MMQYKSWILMLGLLIASSFALITRSTNAVDSHEDDFLYNKMVTIEGTVQILNHPAFGKTPANNNQTILFQRTDCKKSVVAAVTDQDGRYQLHVLQGRYKVIIRYGSREGELEDVLAPDQPRFVEATPSLKTTEFNINIMLPK